MRFVPGSDADRACAAGNCEESIDLLERAVRQQPGDFRFHYRLGVCYGGHCRSHALVDAGMALPYLREALRLLSSDTGAARAVVLEQLGNTMIARASLREAIDCHLAAAEAYQALGMADDWARVEFNLGNSYCDLSEASAENHWEQAVSHYRNSLKIRTRSQDPEHYAAALENLGTAYRQLSDLTSCIRCYRKALWIYTADANPRKCASVHNNLGNAFLSLPGLGAESGARNACRALRHFDRALSLQSPRSEARAYGITQYNRAQAYMRLAQASPAGNFTVAITCLMEASRAFQSCGEEHFTQLVRAQLNRVQTTMI